MSGKMNRRVGVSYLEDKGLRILTKKDDRNFNQRLPPKIRGKHFSNLEYLADAELVWLTPDHSRSFPSLMYDESSDSSYFEQCFFTLNRLGEGSFGSVLRVICKEDSKFYAVKVSKEPFRNDFDRNWKLQEVEHHKKVSSHPNIVTLYEAWEEDRYMFLQMELCRYNLQKLDVMPEEQCWEVLVDMVSALDTLHDLDMGHFDVKLENILMGFDGIYKLSDFGLVYCFKEDKKRLAKEGDAKYLAPELLSTSQKSFTAKADIFSLGISILELAGNLSLPSNGEVWKALRENTFPLAQTVQLSDELFFLLAKMMSPEAAMRPSTKDILNMPRVRALLEQRKSLIQMKGLQPLATTAMLLQYCLATWVVFSAIVYQMFILFKSNVFRLPAACALADHSNSLNKGNTSDPAHFTVGPQDPSASSFVTSTPLINSKDYVLPSSAAIPAVENSNGNRRFREASNNEVGSLASSALFPTPAPTLRGSPRFCLSPSSPRLRVPLAHVPGSNLNIILDEKSLHYSSPSILPFGVSPVRLSHESKQEVKARKRQRMMTPRNLVSSFDDEEEESND